MSKQNLINTIADQQITSKAEAGRIVDAFLDGLKHELAAGRDVQIVGVGTFKVVERAARTVRNPSNGERSEVPAKKVVKFKAGTKLLDAVN
jgi:DNA-binding protein HU-beta